MGQTRVGAISPRVKELLCMGCDDNTPIYLGSANIAHMQAKHPREYRKYGACIGLILATPDYVGTNPTDGSVEYVKEFVVEQEYVKVAVRVSGGNTFYARSMYVLRNNRVHNFVQKGTLKRI